MKVPANPKIYHITHIDNLESIIADGYLLSDTEMRGQRKPLSIEVGNQRIKERRKTLRLKSHPELKVADCVPFYFGPRSVMLHAIHSKTDSPYRGGQEDIIHLEADFLKVTAVANGNSIPWAFTISNAGAYVFRDFHNLQNLDEIKWEAVAADLNSKYDDQTKHYKQAEFLVKSKFPWRLVNWIGVYSRSVANKVNQIIQSTNQRPSVEIRPDWYHHDRHHDSVILYQSNSYQDSPGYQYDTIHIDLKTNDIFEEDVEAIVNPVNCVDVTGRGLARLFKDQFPANFDAYVAACERKEVRLGRMFVFPTDKMTNPRWAINFPTKQHLRSKARIEDIKVGLDALVDEIKRHRITSIAIPPIGTDLDGIAWDDGIGVLRENLGMYKTFKL